MKLALPTLGRAPAKKRADGSLTFDDWLGYFQFDGLSYQLGLGSQTLTGQKQQEILPDLMGTTDGAFRQNGIVYRCVMARANLFSEAVFRYQPLGSYSNGDLYGKPSLSVLEKPWPRGSTRKMLKLMSVYESLAGNAYAFREDADTIRIPRPDWVSVILGSRRPDGEAGDIDTEVLGYAYRTNGSGDPKILLPEQVAHFYTTPNPIFQWRGTSWLQTVLVEIMADKAATHHKLKFFENAATSNTVFTLDANLDPDEFNDWVDKFEDAHQGVKNAYKRIFLAGGADAKVIGADMVQMDFVNSQGHGEARICNAAGIPPVIVGVVKGLDSATYSNYGQAKRVWADGEMRTQWGDLCEAFQPLVDTPADSRLWYDERRIKYLQEDLKDLATTQATQATALRSLIDAGFKPDTAVAMIASGDLGKLVHTGLYSVQLQPPGTTFQQKGAPTQGGTQAVHGLALECTLCHEQAAENRRCPRCRELAGALDEHPLETLRAISGQVHAHVDDLAVKPPEAEKFNLTGPSSADPTMYGLAPEPDPYGLLGSSD